jgi:hypothetical protein
VKSLLIGFSLAVALLSAAVVKRELVNGLEKGFAGGLTASQMRILGYPSGIYIDGYGVVFTSEVNLSFSPMVDPFQQTIAPEVKAKVHAAELLQLPILRNEMRQLLLRSSVTLDTLSPSEQIVVGVKISQQSWQDKSGFPQQIVMQGQKSKLMEAKLGHVPPDSVISVQEQN